MLCRTHARIVLPLSALMTVVGVLVLAGCGTGGGYGRYGGSAACGRARVIPGATDARSDGSWPRRGTRPAT